MPSAITDQPRQVTDRITVALTTRATNDLDDLQKRTELSKTDVVNRAIGLYRLVAEQLDSGCKLAFVDPQTSEMRIVELL